MAVFRWRHFAGEIILWAVRWYCRYGISYRDLEEMMSERGVAVDHSTLYRWTQRYAPELEKRSAWYRSRCRCKNPVASREGQIASVVHA
jgi:IS6 family transposase